MTAVAPDRTRTDPPRAKPTETPPARASMGRRVAAIVRKESIQIIRDPSSIIIAGLLPLLLLFLFSYGVSLDLREVRIAVVVEAPSPQATRLLSSFRGSRYFRIEQVVDRRQAQDRLTAGRLQGLVIIPANFSRLVGRQQLAPLQVISRGTDPNTASLVQNYVESAWQQWLTEESVYSGARASGVSVNLEPRIWFNPDFDSRAALLPGSLAIIMTLIGTLLTALVVAREWERGTMEGLLATPARKWDILIGKFIPYFLLGMGAMWMSVLVAHLILGVPLRGSWWVLTLVAAIFLGYALGLGMLISTVTRNQFVASQAALITGFLPAFELSGLVFEIDSMPWPIRLLTRVLPPRYFVTDLQTLFLAGDVWPVLIRNTAWILLFAVLLLTLTAIKTRERIE